MRILVTGGLGVFGAALLTEFGRGKRPLNDTIMRVGRVACDVRSFQAVKRAVAAFEPEVIVHAAAITDHSCRDATQLIATNIVGTTIVARCARAFNARLVYLSTHYIYGGEAPDGGYDEWAAAAPVGAYAWSKLAGEHAALETCANALVVRGSWYDYESRIAVWLRNGVLSDAWGSRERVSSAAAKVLRLVDGGASGVYNIGWPRRSFVQVCADEGAHDVAEITRDELEWRLAAKLDYAFPRDASVSTAKFDAWSAEQP